MMLRLLQRLRPTLGWPTFLILLMAGACFPLAVHAGRWVDGSGVLIGLGLAGGVVGGWLAGRRLSDGLVWALGIMAGGVVTFVVIGHVLPPLSFLFQLPRTVEAPVTGPGFRDALLRLVRLLVTVMWLYGQELVLRGILFATQISWWVQIALTGGVSQDNDIFLLLVGWLSWSVAFHTMATFTRKRHPGLALAPLGLVVTVAVAGGRGGNEWLYAFLGLGTVLWAQGTYLRQERRWVQERMDYSPEIRLDISLAGILLACVTLVFASTMAWSIPWAGAGLRKPLSGPTQRVATTLDRLFGGVRRPPTGGGEWAQTDFNDLPLTRVLAGPPELREDPVLRVTATIPGEATLPHVYWRGLTYDQYTGRGWANSTGETAKRPPRLIQVTYLGPEIRQRIKLLGAAGPVRYAAADPIRVDADAVWVMRDGQDLIGWYADAEEYMAISRPVMAPVEALRAAPEEYPDWVVERYLQLPAELPARVRQRAEEIVGDAATAYDKAAAIEAAMRAIEYSLEVGPPPPDRDIVDYFLFDMDAGYCDYFATTMTVLARAVGVPARLATGFATGTYDPELGFFIVRKLDAHAWVEVYFPGIGWVPFEPTPARTVFDRSPPPALPLDRAERPPSASIARTQWKWPVLGLIALMTLGGLGLWARQRYRAHRLTPEERVRAAYDAVWRRAGWFGWDGRLNQTPFERVAALENALIHRYVQIRLGSRQLVWRGADAAEDLRRLGMLFVKAQYSRQGVTREEAQAAHSAWHRVRWWLLLLWRT